MATRRVAALAIAIAVAMTSVAAQAPAAISRQTRHLKFTASISRQVIAPGQRFAVTVDVAPKRGMHVYAPGSKYRSIAIVLQPQPPLRVRDTVYPPASRYYFKPLNETVDVYEKPFRLTVELESVAGVTASETIVVRGALEYQACDDRVCYLPESVPFEWTIRMKP